MDTIAEVERKEEAKEAHLKLTGRYVVGTRMVGLEVTDDNGDKKILKHRDVYELVRRGQVKGCKLVKYRGQTYIRSELDKIADLPDVGIKIADDKKLKLTYRIKMAGKLVGYGAVDSTGREFKLTKHKVWELARQGAIEGLTAFIIKDNEGCPRERNKFNGLASCRWGLMY